MIRRLCPTLFGNEDRASSVEGTYLVNIALHGRIPALAGTRHSHLESGFMFDESHHILVCQRRKLQRVLAGNVNGRFETV